MFIATLCETASNGKQSKMFINRMDKKSCGVFTQWKTTHSHKRE
jgi:hypothetical protein